MVSGPDDLMVAHCRCVSVTGIYPFGDLQVHPRELAFSRPNKVVRDYVYRVVALTVKLVDISDVLRMLLYPYLGILHRYRQTCLIHSQAHITDTGALANFKR